MNKMIQDVSLRLGMKHMQYLKPGMVKSLIDSDPLCWVQHQHSPHQILGTLWYVAPLSGVHLREHTYAFQKIKQTLEKNKK